MLFNVYILVFSILLGVVTFFAAYRLIEILPARIIAAHQGEPVHVPHEYFSISTNYRLAVSVAVSLLTAAVLIHSGISPESMGFVLYFFVVVLLAGINHKHQLLPDLLVLPMIPLGIAFHVYLGHPWRNYVNAAIMTFFIPFILNWFAKRKTGKEMIGLGDCKMLGMMGAWFGFHYMGSIWILFIASILFVGILSATVSKNHNPMGTGIIYLIISFVLYFHGVVG